MLTGRQVRETRKLIRWSVLKLSRETCLSQTTLRAIESSDGAAWLTEEQEMALRRVLDGRGIEFASADGTRLRKVEPT